jgi:hypothetical protein
MGGASLLRRLLAPPLWYLHWRGLARALSRRAERRRGPMSSSREEQGDNSGSPLTRQVGRPVREPFDGELSSGGLQPANGEDG